MPTLQFKGKPFVQNHHLAVKHHPLLPHKEFSLTGKVSLHDNLVIQGDNLKALKALLPAYAGKIKCIYIDPPYNTGNENWSYNDNVNSPMLQEWLDKVVDKEDMTRHDKWLCMMMPRLKLLRELLREDGVIFISIDDNEQHTLRMLMDEIFGRQNFIQNIIWEKKFSPQNDAKYFSDNHDFILCYAKNKIEGEQKDGWKINLLPRTEEMEARYKNPDNDGRGVWTSGDISVKTYSAAYDYEIVTPAGKKVKPPRGACWRFSKEKLQELIEDNRIWFGESGENVPRLKRFLSEVKQGLVPVSIWKHSEVGHNQEARHELKEIFDKESFPFETPKPVRLLKRIIQISTGKADIILDSFAGSGTTGQAVLEVNKEDNGNRKFILIEQEEYANAVTAERVRRVIKNSRTTNNVDDNFDNTVKGSFSYFTLGEPIETESLLRGRHLPCYKDFARYLFYTATNEEFDEEAIEEKIHFIGESKNYQLYLFYKPDLEWLKQNGLTFEICKSLPAYRGKQRLVFAPAKYVDDNTLQEYKIDFCQLPYEIYCR